MVIVIPEAHVRKCMLQLAVIQLLMILILNVSVQMGVHKMLRQVTEAADSIPKEKYPSC